MKEQALQFGLNTLLSFASGELTRYAGRKAGAFEAGERSYNAIPVAGGLATEGIQLARGNKSVAAAGGAATGTALALLRPHLFKNRFMSEKEKAEKAIVDAARELGRDPLRDDPYVIKEFQDELNAWYGHEVNWLQVLADDPGVIAEVAMILLPEEAKRYKALTGKYARPPERAEEFMENFANWISAYLPDEGDIDETSEVYQFLFGVEAVYK